MLDFIKKIFRQSTFLKIYGIYTNLRSVGPPPPPPSMGPKLGDRFIFNTPIAIVGIWFASLARHTGHRGSLCYAMTARRDVGSIAWHWGKVRARVRASSRQGASEARCEARWSSIEALRQGARRDDRALRHRATRSSRGIEASCAIDAHATARGWREPHKQNLSEGRAP